MVAAAARRLGQPVILADGHGFDLADIPPEQGRHAEPVDAVFSNAALHWMTEPTRVLASVRRALRPGGRFVAEMGGARNVRTIIDAVRTALAESGLAADMAPPWYFPTPGQYATLLEQAGFRVALMEYFPRPTPLAHCPNGAADWVDMFGGRLIASVPDDLRAAVLARVNALTEARLRRDGTWYADYWRLRFLAIAEPSDPGADDAPAAAPG
jgi:trans-aconitate methyltransferase